MILEAVETKHSEHDEVDQNIGRKGEQLLLHHHFKVGPFNFRQHAPE